MGLWSSRLNHIVVSTAPISSFEGWYADGEITLPIFELHPARWFRPRTHLIDTLRHEFAHALADCHSGLIRKLRFSKVFGVGYDNRGVSFVYDPVYHVTEYASSNACEDFAETFALFVKHKGRLPKAYNTASIREKWKFIERFRTLLKEKS